MDIQHVTFEDTFFSVKTGTAKLNMADIPKDGVYEPWLTKYLSIASEFYGADKDAIDIGANVGIISLFLSSLQKDGKVIAFEPLSVMYDFLKINLLENKITNVVPYKMIISDSDDKWIFINASEGNSAGGAFVSKGKIIRRSLHSEKGKTITLDSFIDNNPKKLDVKIVKIDVECWEEYVLKGSHNTLKKHQPVVFIEFNVQNRCIEIEKHGKKQFDEMYLLFKHIYLINRLTYKLMPINTYSDLRGAMLTGHFVEDLLCFNDDYFLTHLKPYITDISYSCYHAAKVSILNSKTTVNTLSQYPDSWNNGHDFFLLVNPVQTTTLRLRFSNKGPHKMNKIIVTKDNLTEEISLKRDTIVKEFTFEGNKFSSVYTFIEKKFLAKEYFSIGDPRELGLQIEIV